MSTRHSDLPRAVRFLGVRMFPWTMQQTLQEINRRLEAGRFTQHVVVNVAKIVNMRKDVGLREAVHGCDIINIDGMGVVWGARLLGIQVPERVAGVDLFFALLELASRRGEAVFFLGAREEVVEAAVRNIRGRYPGLNIAGWHHGYFWGDEEVVVRRIAASGATMLFVAISSPKKEQFIYQWRDRLGVRFAMGVGGTFDIVAGVTRRAPEWMQKTGMEWFYRVLQEPRRMWKRYLLTNSRFAWLLTREMTRAAVTRYRLLMNRESN